jgi:hypothetical protein
MSLSCAAQELRAGDSLRRVLGVQIEGKPLDCGAEPSR